MHIYRASYCALLCFHRFESCYHKVDVSRTECDLVKTFWKQNGFPAEIIQKDFIVQVDTEILP